LKRRLEEAESDLDCPLIEREEATEDTTGPDLKPMLGHHPEKARVLLFVVVLEPVLTVRTGCREQSSGT
jgi:hypothetical protein